MENSIHSPRTTFHFVDGPEPHLARTRAILKKHPEVKQLIGKRNPWTFAIILLGLGAQFGLAYLVGARGQGWAWWQAALLAYFVGTIINHAFIAIVHDASHNLIWRNRTANTLSGILVNLPMFVPSFVSFRKFHMKHHAFQGVYELDADLPADWEAKLVSNRWYGKMIWLAFYPLWQSLRPKRVSEVVFWDFWTILNVVAVFGVDLLVLYYLGWVSLLYMFISFWFGFGLSIVGARLIQEHYMTNDPQETYSYYGWLNIPSLNVAYHNEHHDFPSVPWNLLPQIKRIAPEYYDSLTSYRSYLALLIRFITDSNMSLYDRIRRSDRNGVALDAPVTPDAFVASGQT